MNTNYTPKRKSVNDKEIMDFLIMLEDKFENNSQKLQNFYEIFNKYNNSGEEEILVKLRDVLAEHPVLILELNKMLPRTNRMPLVDQERADNFLMKIKNKDDAIFREIMKVINAYKKTEITLERLITKFEEYLYRYPDLLEEAYFFLDYKRINNNDYKKKIVGKIQQTKYDARRSGDMKEYKKYRDSLNMTPSKNQRNPEYSFFDSIRSIFDHSSYSTFIKLLHLFNEGIVNQDEFCNLVQPYFTNHIDLFDYLRTLTYAKMMNRRKYAIINKPLSELDLSKSTRIGTSYSELPKNYPSLICSGRTPELCKMLNDKYISIPAGSEDDKNPLKKNHYEEHIFKFEDQRYEIDMMIEILKATIVKLNSLNDKVVENEMTEINLETDIPNSTKSYISMFYKEYSTKILEGLTHHPKDTIPIVINRFKKRIEEAHSQKTDLEKNIKLSFDKFYQKSFDYRSFKFKSLGKNNNAKSFIKEINNRKKNKLASHNLNVVKGGIENFEFYFSMNFKNSKENIQKYLKSSEDEILLKYLSNLDNTDMNFKKKFPDMRLIMDSEAILSISITLIYYQIHFSNTSDSGKIINTLNFFFEQIFQINSTNLVNLLNSDDSPVQNDKDLSYNEGIDLIKNKNTDMKIFDKFLKIDTLANTVQSIREPNSHSMNNLNSLINSSPKIPNDNNSDISLTPSLQSQDTGKTFKDIVIRDENCQEEFEEKLRCTNFIPEMRRNHILFYCNENCFVLIRFIYCIYERVKKLYENSDHFKSFIVIYKALIHKKIDSTGLYEELCREILGNESYFLFNLDKIINSLVKTINSINNDQASKDMISLFVHEKTRKFSQCENLYLRNFFNLCEGSVPAAYRILYSPLIRAMAIHLFEFPGNNEIKESENFKEFFDVVLHESYGKLQEENETMDEPFNVFLKRNIKKVSYSRSRPTIMSNNLLYNFDPITKNIVYFKSDSDVLYYEKKPFEPTRRLKKIIKKNISFRLWIEAKISKINK